MINVFLLSLALLSFFSQSDIKTTEQLIQAMCDRYATRWYKTLTFVRLLQPAGRDGAQTQEVQFNKYKRAGDGWISPEVIIKLDDGVVMTEECSEIKAGVKLDPSLFDAEHWRTTRWR